MAKTVQLSHHYTIEGLNYLPGDVVSVTDDTAARIILNRLGVVVPDGTPVTPLPDPFPQYLRQEDADEIVEGISTSAGLVMLKDQAIAARDGAQAAANSVTKDVPGGLAGIEADGFISETRLPTVKKTNWFPGEHKSFHPSNRPVAERFDGNSHPLSQYFSSLANAQALYPHATSLTDETDWAALQLALNTTTIFPRQWGSLFSDWRQYGTALIELPIGAHAVINRPLVKAANANRNYVIGCQTLWGARIRYTGTDGGRMFDFERDGVGTVLDVNNLRLQGAGIRIKGQFRGDIRVGAGCMVVDSPHPALELVDTDPAALQVGVVGINISNFYTENCAGGVRAVSSTATITKITDSRFLSCTGVAVEVDTIDFLMDNIDFTGISDLAAAASGTYPFVWVHSKYSPASNVELSNVRFGSEGGTGTLTFAPPKEYVVVGDVGAPNDFGVSKLKMRKCSFRAQDATMSSTMSRVAILLNARTTYDIDQCDFEGFKDWLIEEAYVDNYGGNLGISRWGINTVATNNHAPNFSKGGVDVQTTTGAPPVDRRTVVNPTPGPNLFSTDLTTFSTSTTCTIGALTPGGPNGSHYYPITKTGAAARFYRTPFPVTPGKRYNMGITARLQAGSASKDIKFRVAFIGANTQVIVDQRTIRLDSDWVTYTYRMPYVPAGVTGINISYYVDDQELSATGGVDVLEPFLSEGWTPKIPQNMHLLSARRVAPNPPQAGATYRADGVAWDPLTRGGTESYLTFYTGSAWHAVSHAEVTGGGGGGSSTSFQSSNATTTTTPASDATETTLSTLANIPTSKLNVGDIIEVDAYGTLDTQVSPGNMNLRTKINGTQQVLTPLATIGATSAGANLPWRLNLKILITATGNGGAYRITGTQTRASGNTNVQTTDNVGPTDVSQNLSGGLQVVLTGQTVTASATNIIRHHGSMVKKV